MVNCAGIVGPTNIVVEDISTQDFDHVYSGMTLTHLIISIIITYFQLM